MKITSKKAHPTDYRGSAKVFSALGNESSLKIFITLSRNRKMCVSDVSRGAGLSLSATSHQLAKLEAAGLIRSVREGRNICYLFNKSRLTSVLCSCFGCTSESKK